MNHIIEQLEAGKAYYDYPEYDKDLVDYINNNKSLPDYHKQVLYYMHLRTIVPSLIQEIEQGKYSTQPGVYKLALRDKDRNWKCPFQRVSVTIENTPCPRESDYWLHTTQLRCHPTDYKDINGFQLCYIPNDMNYIFIPRMVPGGEIRIDVIAHTQGMELATEVVPDSNDWIYYYDIPITKEDI